MERSLVRRGIRAGIILTGFAAILYIFATPAFSQTKAPATKKATSVPGASKSPRSLDGHPDLTGFWGVLFGNFAVSADGKEVTAGLTTPYGKYENDKDLVAARVSQFVGADPDNPAERIPAGDLRRKAAYEKNPNLVPPYKPELIAKVKDLSEHANEKDPAFHCFSPGLPRIGPPLQILQTPGQVVFFYELIKGANHFRIIPTDGRPHSKSILEDATSMGSSVGHWEGETLVIDSVNFDPDTWLGNDGWFHGPKMHIVERLKRTGDTIKYDVTVEDPDVLTRPWIKDPALLNLNPDKNARIFEQGPCIESDSEHLVNNDRN